MTDALFTLTGTTPAAPSTAVVGAPAVFATYIDAPESLDICASLIGATGGTLDLFLQTSPDGGATWFDYGHYAQLAAGAAAFRNRVGVSRFQQALTPVVVGVNLTPLLAAATFVGGPFNDRMRLVAVAGAGTTAGAVITIQLRPMGTNGVSNARA